MISTVFVSTPSSARDVHGIEALRVTSGDASPPGLLRGLADTRVAKAMRQMHTPLARPWTVAQLAKAAANHYARAPDAA